MMRRRRSVRPRARIDLRGLSRAALVQRLRDWTDVILASDPGLSRFIQALEVAAAIGVSIAAEYGLAMLAHPLWSSAPPGVHLSAAQSAQLATQHHALTLVTMLFGGLVAMMSTLAVMDVTLRDQTVTMVGLPVPLLATLALAIELSRWHVVGLVGLALVMGLGTYARKFAARFGPRAFFYGLLMFIGYFFGFLAGSEIGLSGLGWVAAILWLAVAVNLLLRVTVYLPLARGTVARSRRSFLARARGVLGAGAELLLARDGREHRRWQRRLDRRLVRLNEAALIIDGQLGDPRVGLAAEQAETLHERLFDLELTVANLARAVRRLAGCPGAQLERHRAAGWLRDLRAGGVVRGADEWTSARRSEREERPVGAPLGAGDLADVVALVLGDLVDAARGWSSSRGGDGATVGAGTLGTVAGGALADGGPRAAADQGPTILVADAGATVTGAVHPRTDAYESPISLMGGNLAGSSQVSRGVAEPEAGLLARLHLDAPAQTAIRVALAVGAASAAGSALSERRFYWAVIAVFITFMGANTAGEQVSKAMARVLGTSVGIVLGSLLATAVGPSVWSLAVIIPSISIGVYFLRVSYSLMVIGITVMVAQLYMQLGEYSSSLLVLRLEETALGAAIAMIAALTIFPVSTRKSTRAAARTYLSALDDLLGCLSDRFAGTGDIDARQLTRQARELDDALQQLVATARPLARDPFLRHDVEHNLALLVAGAHYARNLVAAARAVGAVERSHAEGLLTVIGSERELVQALMAAVAPGGEALSDARAPLTQAGLSAVGDRVIELGRRVAAAGVARRDPRRQALRALERLDATMTMVAGNLGVAASD